MVANPLAGDLADALVMAGGSVVISETMEWTGTEENLYTRCRNPQVADELRTLISERQRIAKDFGMNLVLDNPGPQNRAGGITTLEEKSFGAVIKGGTGPIVGALRQAATIPQDAGLYLMDTPVFSPESISSMIAGGAQMVAFTTGQGNPYGSALAPTLKITGNPDTAQRLKHQIDFDASQVFRGLSTRDEVLPQLAGSLVSAAEGALVAAEIAQECDEAISRLLPSI